MVDITYDKYADAVYIYFSSELESGDVARQVVVEEIVGRGEIMADFDSQGRILGIEIIGARSLVEPQLLADARRIDNRTDEECASVDPNFT